MVDRDDVLLLLLFVLLVFTVCISDSEDVEEKSR